MEPVSFALALGSIPGIFFSCVECFRCVQLGREFEIDFERTILKLESVEMRLTRWGAAVGIDDPDVPLRQGDYTEYEIQKAYEWLSKIERMFKQALEASSEYKSNNHNNGDKLKVLDTDSEVVRGSTSLQALHRSMRKISNERVKTLKYRKRDRISWALYRKGSFQNLIETVSDLTDNLIELFPAKVNSQESLCKSEVMGIDKEALSLLLTVIDNDDELLKQAIKSGLESGSIVFTNIEVKDESKAHFGYNIGAGESSRSSVYSNIKAGGNSITHFGNNVGNFQGRTMFDALR